MAWDVYFTAGPAADRIEGSRHHNMKELRSFGGHLRALLVADDLYDEHLRTLIDES